VRKILVALDGSDCSERAMTFALELARTAGASLQLVHVIAPLLIPAPLSEDALGKLERGARESARALLERGEQLALDAQVATGTLILRGSPAETIVEAAEDPEVWVVVVGSRGKGGVARALLGSVAVRVVRLCRKPVTVVH
jgi:nucleotide-binding universal stress UspA family protein